MPIIAKNEGGNFALPPEGTHIAICYQMIHYGTVQEEYMGEMKTQQKVRLTFELCHETHTFREENGPECFSVSQEYTLSMHEKATLRLHLQSWRGKAFTEEEASAFDITVLVGVPCQVNVIHKTSKKDKQYVQIAGLAGIPKGMVVPERTNDLVVFTPNEWDSTIYESLPEFLRLKIAGSSEGQAYFTLHGGGITTVTSEEVQPTEGNVVQTAPADDLPF